MQVQDFALARQEVVIDIESLHRLQMAAEHGGRDQICDLRRFVAARLDGMQRFQT